MGLNFVFREQYTAQVWKTMIFESIVLHRSENKLILRAVHCMDLKNKVIFETSILHGCENQTDF